MIDHIASMCSSDVCVMICLVAGEVPLRLTPTFSLSPRMDHFQDMILHQIDANSRVLTVAIIVAIGAAGRTWLANDTFCFVILISGCCVCRIQANNENMCKISVPMWDLLLLTAFR